MADVLAEALRDILYRMRFAQCHTPYHSVVETLRSAAEREGE